VTIVLRYNRRAITATNRYRTRLAERLDRSAEDVQYAWLRARAEAAFEREWDGDGYCRCGAHTIDTPCFLPDVRDQGIGWSVKVPERAALAVVREDGAA
jgi:hypothetical protein